LTSSADSDFEVVPHVRSVIVLDDIVAHEITIDEPWEHIYGDKPEDSLAKTPSYAKILADK
jgi:hypothetical protein